MPYSANASSTSPCVKPKRVWYLAVDAVTTVRLFRSEKIDSRLTRVTPVIRARPSAGLVLKVEFIRSRINLEACPQ